MTKIIDDPLEPPGGQERWWPTFVRRQLPIMAAIGIAAYLWKSEPRPVSITAESRTAGRVTIVWTLYDGRPTFAYIYNTKPAFDKVLRRSSTNSRGELRITHGAADGTLVDIACDSVDGPLTIADAKYDLSRGRTFTIDLQHSGAVAQHDLEVPLPMEPESSEKPYVFGIPNQDVTNFIRKSNVD